MELATFSSRGDPALSYETINNGSKRGEDMLKKNRLIITSAALLVAGIAISVTGTGGTGVAAQQSKRPNLLLIVADDLGYSDLGSYGGEINTPVLDNLAKKGARYTNFYVSPTCSVTRSMLLSGTDNHVAGLGNMGELLAPNQVGKPGYEGVLNRRVASVAELLRDNGYHTYMAGKWHLGLKPDQIPHARGFERDFSLLVGGGSHFDDQWNLEWQIPKAPYTEDGRPVERLPKDFYSSKAYTDKTIQFIEEGRPDGRLHGVYGTTRSAACAERLVAPLQEPLRRRLGRDSQSAPGAHAGTGHRGGRRQCR
jgi:arylsulfatase A-like enzyme